jgi:hypothetical protein
MDGRTRPAGVAVALTHRSSNRTSTLSSSTPTLQQSIVDASHHIVKFSAQSM